MVLTLRGVLGDIVIAWPLQGNWIGNSCMGPSPIVRARQSANQHRCVEHGFAAETVPPSATLGETPPQSSLAGRPCLLWGHTAACARPQHAPAKLYSLLNKANHVICRGTQQQQDSTRLVQTCAVHVTRYARQTRCSGRVQRAPQPLHFHGSATPAGCRSRKLSQTLAGWAPLRMSRSASTPATSAERKRSHRRWR